MLRRSLLNLLLCGTFLLCGRAIPASSGSESGFDSRDRTIVGRVVSITDGDTITVLDEDRVQHRIRLYGIDAPERRQAFGEAARHHCGEVAFGQSVTVRVLSVDRYGRTVGDVILPSGTTVSKEMVRAGLAWWYRRYAPHDEELEGLEAEARQQRIGLWGYPAQTPPWEFRRSAKQKLCSEAHKAVI